MKFKYILLALFLFLLAGVFVVYNKRDLGIRSGSQIYAFSQLEKSQAALVHFQGKYLSSQSPFAIPFDAILDQHYASLVQKKNELVLASALEQFALQSKNSVSVGQAKPARSLTEICFQYGFRCPNQDKVQFDGPQNYYLKVDGRLITENEIKTDSVALKAAHSEILDYLLSRINEKIRTKLLYLLAKEKNQSVQDFVDASIVREQDVREWAKQTGALQSTNENEQQAYANLFYQQHKDRLISDFLLKNYIQKPISVNIQKPQFEFETRWEWTPFFGIAPRKNSVHVVLFYDLYSQSSRETLKMLLAWREKKMDFTMGFRPSFAENDRMQRFLTEYLFCAWLKNPDQYWKLLSEFISLKAQISEQDAHALTAKVGADVKAIKQCAIKRETKDIVEYHLKTAQFLRLHSLPTLFIGNEVRVGPLNELEFERVLSRQ